MARYMRRALPWLVEVQASHVFETHPFEVRCDVTNHVTYLSMDDTVFIGCSDEDRLSLNMMRIRGEEVPDWLARLHGGWEAIDATAQRYADMARR